MGSGHRCFGIACLFGVVAGFAQAMPFVDLVRPDEVLLDDRPTDRVTVAADGTVALAGGEASFIRLKWKAEFPRDARVYGSQWERGYGRLAWHRVDDVKRPYKGALNWYALVTDGRRTDGYGVKVQPNAFASWTLTGDGLELLLDVRAGSRPVQLGARRLAAAQLVSRKGRSGENAFTAARAFCHVMCPRPRLAKEPVFGYNDWYCAYGKNTATNFLADVRRYVEAFDRLGPCANRPYAVVDDGWQVCERRGYDPGAEGQWAGQNCKWGLPMDRVAAELEAMGARAGLWYRPLEPWSAMPEAWRLESRVKGKVFSIDPTASGLADAIEEDLRRFRSWGYSLVKIDFLTIDWGGAGSGDRVLTDPRAQWRDRSRTSAEVVLGLYRRMREGAGDMLIIGCNAIDHFAAGLFELQRTGQDVCGFGWDMTRFNGVNALGQRAHQNGIFYQADPDCVCIAGEGFVPWGLNRQWLDAVAQSGTALFVSWPRALAPIGSPVLDEIAKAWQTAAHTTETAEPLDWERELWPRQWRLSDGRRLDYDWCFAEDADVTCGTAPRSPGGDRGTLRLAAGEWSADVDWTGKIRLSRAGRAEGEVRPYVVVRGQRRDRPMVWEFLRDGETVVCRNDYGGGLKVVTTVSLAANGDVKVRQDCSPCVPWETVPGRVGIDCGDVRAQDVEVRRFDYGQIDWTLTPVDFVRR